MDNPKKDDGAEALNFEKYPKATYERENHPKELKIVIPPLPSSTIESPHGQGQVRKEA